MMKLKTEEAITEILPGSVITLSVPEEGIFFFNDIAEVEELYKQHQVMRL